MGGNQFTEEIQRRFNINFNDAEDAKKGGEVAGVDPEELAEVIKSVAMNLTGEIKRSVDFFLAGSQVFISKIMLSGGGSMTGGLIEMLQDRSGLNVEFVDPFNNIEGSDQELDGKPLKDMSVVLCGCGRACHQEARRQMIRINLLPVRAAKKKETIRFQLTIAGLFTFFVVAATILFYISYQ